MPKDSVLIGIGNPLIKDDRAGIEVAEHFENKDVPFNVEIQYTVGFEVLDKLLGHKRAMVVDACQLGHEPGTIIELGSGDILGDDALATSHAVTLGATIESGYNLFPDEMPEELSIMLIEVEDISGFGDQCTPRVQAAVNRAVKRVENFFSD